MPPKMFMGPLMDQAGDGTGTGDGKATVLDEKALATVNTMINGALAKFGKDELPKAIKTATTEAVSGLSTQLTALTENLTTLQASIPKPADDGKKKTEVGDDGLTPAARAEFQRIQKALDTANSNFAAEKTAREAAEATTKLDKRNNAIRAELGQFQYASPEAAEDAFNSISGKVDYDADGNLLADGLLLKDFVSTFIPEKKAYLLAPADKGGSGATGGKGRGGQAKVDLADITVANMQDPKKAQAAAQAIMAALRT